MIREYTNMVVEIFDLGIANTREIREFAAHRGFTVEALNELIYEKTGYWNLEEYKDFAQAKFYELFPELR